MSNEPKAAIEHPIYQVIEDCSENISDAPKLAQGKDLHRTILPMQQNFSFWKKALHDVDKNLLTTAMLDQLQPHAQNLLSHLQAYVNEHNEDSITQARTHLNTLIQEGHIIFSLRAATLPTPDIQRIYHQTVEENIASMKATQSQFIETAQNELKAINTAMKTAQSQFQKKAESDLDAIKTKTSELETNVDQAASNLADQTQRTTDALQKFSTDSAAAEENRQTTFRNQQQKLEAAAQKLLQEMEELKQQAAEAVGATGNITMAWGYQKAAHRARFSELSWQGATSLAILVVAVVAVLTIKLLGSPASVEVAIWQILLPRLFLVTPISIFAVYAAGQATKQGKLAQYNKRMELEMATLEPYLVHFEKEEKKEIKKELVQRLFGNASLEENESTKEDSLGVIQGIISLLKELKKF